MSTLSTRILDHIVHLVPPGTLQDSIEAFRKLGFTVSPGGTHADGLTANALVIFPDGTYLELLHFTHAPPSESSHPWAKKQPGWIDCAFLGNAGTPSIAETINARAEKEGSGTHYATEARGGRKREDGKILEWLISGPEGEGVRGRLPFFCGDLTPRGWRVPFEPRSNLQHENTAAGVAHVKFLVAPEDLEASAKQIRSVVGAVPSASTSTQATWDLEEQPSHPGTNETTPKLILSAAQNDEEQAFVRERGPGVFELGFVVAKGSKEGIAKTPCGRIVWRPTGSQ